MITLYDADRCPFCARVRIVLAEKGIPYETVVVDLDDRPAWLYEKNELGKVPVLEEDTLCLPESPVIMEYLEDRYPEPALLPVDPAERSLARLLVWRFDELLGDDYYAVRRGVEGAEKRLYGRLEELDRTLEEQRYLGGAEFGLADAAYYPWLPRCRAHFGIDLHRFPGIVDWCGRLSERPSVAAELEIVAALPR